jgi:hypothetical protein
VNKCRSCGVALDESGVLCAGCRGSLQQTTAGRSYPMPGIAPAVFWLLLVLPYPLAIASWFVAVDENFGSDRAMAMVGCSLLGAVTGLMAFMFSDGRPKLLRVAALLGFAINLPVFVVFFYRMAT